MLRAIALLIAVSLSACGLFHKKNHSTGGVVNSDAQKEIYYQAEVQYEAENYKEAKELFLKFVKQSPTPASGYYRLACIERINNDLDLALQLSKKAQNADTGDDYYYRLFDAEVYRQARAFEKAGKIYSDLAATHKNHWSLYSDAAKMYQAAGDMNVLIELCNQWEKEFGLREDIANTRSAAFARAGMQDSASAEYLKLIKKYPERRQYKLAYARALQTAGHPEKAIEVYNELLTQDPENAELLVHLCQYYKESNQPAKHWNLAKKVAASHQMDLYGKQNCILAFLTPTNAYFDSMQPVLEEISLLHPTESLAWKMLADWHFEHHNYLPAANAYSRNVGMITSDYSGWTKYCQCLERLMQYSRMQKVTDSMEDLFPSNPEVYNFSAIAWLELRNFEKATEQANLGLSFAVEPATQRKLKITLAHVLGHSGKYAEALDLLKEIENKNEIDFEIKNEMVNLYLVNGKKEEAHTLIDVLLTKKDNPEYAKTLGMEALARNKDDNAIEFFTMALTADDGRVETIELLGDAYFQLKNEELAKKYWLQAQNLGSGSPTLAKKIKSVTPN